MGNRLDVGGVSLETSREALRDAFAKSDEVTDMHGGVRGGGRG
jgi:hypothetical protein